MKSVKSVCFYLSEKVKWYKIKGNIGVNDSYLMYRGVDYGYIFWLSFD